MVILNEPEKLSSRTKLLLACYLASGGVALLIIGWIAIVTLTYFMAGEKAVQSLPAGFVFPWLPIAVLVLLTSKFALIWSSRKDRQSDKS